MVFCDVAVPRRALNVIERGLPQRVTQTIEFVLSAEVRPSGVFERDGGETSSDI